MGYVMSFTIAGGGSIDFLTINSTWAPAASLPLSASEAAPTGPETGL